MRTIILLLFSVCCFGQEIYPGEAPCFGVPNADSNFPVGNTYSKQDKIYLDQIIVTYCGTGPEVINLDSLFIRDNTNPAYVSTDYYNQKANDQINEVLRTWIANNNPSWGGQDDVGIIFNSRLKDPPSTAGNACDVNIDGTNPIHSFRVVTAFEFLNKNWRIGASGGGKVMQYITFRLQLEKGGVTTEYSAQCPLLPACLTAAPEYNPNCATRWGSSGNRSSMHGYFTEKSVPKLWRQSRNDWRFNNAGFWPGQVPYTGFLTEAKRRCFTFASFSCSDLTQATNDEIADRILASGVEGNCIPFCGGCQDIVTPYLEILPPSDCPSTTNGYVKLINPNPGMTGTYELFKNGVSQGTGALPNTSIDVKTGWTMTDMAEGWAIRLYRPGCDTLIYGFAPNSFSYTTPGPDCATFVPWTKLALEFNPGRCGIARTGTYINRMQVPTTISQIKFNSGENFQVLSSAIDANPGRPICMSHDTYDGTGSNYRTIEIDKPKASLLSVNLFMQKLICPCPTKNRYIVFNAAGLSGTRKADLIARGWEVLP